MGITVQLPTRFERLLKRKENSSQDLGRRLEVQLRCRAVYPHPDSGILT